MYAIELFLKGKSIGFPDAIAYRKQTCCSAGLGHLGQAIHIISNFEIDYLNHLITP